MNVCLPLPHAIVYVFRFAISNQANCHKTGEQHIKSVYMFYMRAGLASQTITTHHNEPGHPLQTQTRSFLYSYEVDTVFQKCLFAELV